MTTFQLVQGGITLVGHSYGVMVITGAAYGYRCNGGVGSTSPDNFG